LANRLGAHFFNLRAEPDRFPLKSKHGGL
jgi:hypothetical protein